MSEIAVRNDSRLAQVATAGPTGNTMRLVEWAAEAQAAYSLAENLCGTPFAGSWKGDAYGAAAAILKGSEVGLTPVTALGAFDNIQGTPAPKAITLRALVQAHGHDLEIVEENDQRAVARYRRHGQGDWLTTEFTVEHARAMRLLGKDNWQKQLGAMLIARVTSKAARLVASDVILGIGYSAEEIRDETAWDGTTKPPIANAAAGGGAAERLNAALSPQTADSEGSPAETPVAGGEAGSSPAGNASESAPTDQRPSESPLLNTRGALAKRMFATINDAGITDKERLPWITGLLGREITTSKEMTDADAHKVIDHLTEAVEAPFEPPADQS